MSYDNDFLKYEGAGRKQIAVNTINGIIILARQMFKWKSLQTEIEIDILDIKHVDTSLRLHEENPKAL